MRASCRRFVLLFSTLFALFFCISDSQAQERKQGQEAKQRLGGGNPLSLFQRIEQDSAKLELTADQKGKLDALLAETHKTVDPLIETARGGDASARQTIQKVMQDLRPKLIEAIGQEATSKLQRAPTAGGRPAEGQPAARGKSRGGGETNAPSRPASKIDVTTLIPIPELGSQRYQGFKGGYYPGGKNERPAAHEAAGLSLVKQIQPLDANGKPSTDGKIVLLTCGMSNTTMQSKAFIEIASSDPEKNPVVVIVDGAQGGKTAKIIQDPEAPYWTIADDRLKAAGVTRSQVQVVWLKEADARPTDPFPKHTQTFQMEMENIVRLIHVRFPNVKQIFVSNRTFGGYATTELNPEPYAYETGFGVKWLIEKQINGDLELNYDPAKGTVKAPWMSWGPDLWTNGTTPRKADGFTYDIDDVQSKDGTHPSDSGRLKVAQLLLKFFKNDPTTKPWFMAKK